MDDIWNIGSITTERNICRRNQKEDIQDKEREKEEQVSNWKSKRESFVQIVKNRHFHMLSADIVASTKENQL